MIGEKLILTGLSITEGTPNASLAVHLDKPAISKRTPIHRAIAKIKTAVEDYFRSYLKEHGFESFHPPCLIGAASEGGANVFKLPYFGKEAYLAQSPQFYKQFEIAGGAERIYCVGPVFRAENSNTPRHMTEVYLLSFYSLHSIQPYAKAPFASADPCSTCSSLI